MNGFYQRLLLDKFPVCFSQWNLQLFRSMVTFFWGRFSCVFVVYHLCHSLYFNSGWTIFVKYRPGEEALCAPLCFFFTCDPITTKLGRMVLWHKIPQKHKHFDEIITIMCGWHHRAVFPIVWGRISRSSIFCPIWMKFCRWVNFKALILNLNFKNLINIQWARKMLFLSKIWKSWSSVL